MRSSLRSRRLFLLALFVLGGAGFVLVVTAPSGEPELESVVTGEGLSTAIPAGWERSDAFAFQFQPAGGGAEVFERWTVARACGPEGCAARSLEAWLDQAVALPTFVQARAPEAGLSIVRDEFGVDHRILEARTSADTTFVFVAAFSDGASFYVECGLSLGVDGDVRLVEAVIDVCRSTEAIDGG